MSLVTALIAGFIFGIGLLISGMTNPAKIQNFLDIFGQWDPSLAFVMGGAIAVTAPGYYFLRKQSGTFLGTKFQWPTRNDIDKPLVAGAAMFGVGWGLSGFCPGPAIAALPLALDGVTGAFWFVPSMLVGLIVAKVTNSQNPQ